VFIANLFHNTKITGTYTELTQGGETAVLFSHNGETTVEDGAGSFRAPGLTTVVGGITNGILTIPIDWDCGHDHGLDFTYRAYPLIYEGENGQTITLHADNSFAASFSGDVTIYGFYGIRLQSVTFVPGSPTFNNSGALIGTVLTAGLITEDGAQMLEIPELWVEASGGGVFILR
jgi:hypothetical protein